MGREWAGHFTSRDDDLRALVALVAQRATSAHRQVRLKISPGTRTIRMFLAASRQPVASETVSIQSQCLWQGHRSLPTGCHGSLVFSQPTTHSNLYWLNAEFTYYHQCFTTPQEIHEKVDSWSFFRGKRQSKDAFSTGAFFLLRGTCMDLGDLAKWLYVEEISLKQNLFTCINFHIKTLSIWILHTGGLEWESNHGAGLFCGRRRAANLLHKTAALIRK